MNFDDPTEQLRAARTPLPSGLDPARPRPGTARPEQPSRPRPDGPGAPSVPDPDPTGVLSLDEIFPSTVAAPPTPDAPAAETGAPPAAETPVPAYPSGATAQQIRADAAAAFRGVAGRSRSWLREGDNPVIAATVVVALILLLTLIAVGT